MPERKYTLTIFVAGAGTPLYFKFERYSPKIDEHTGKQKTSGPGHVFYGISNDGGKTVTAYGLLRLTVRKNLTGILLTNQEKSNLTNIKFIGNRYIEKR